MGKRRWLGSNLFTGGSGHRHDAASTAADLSENDVWSVHDNVLPGPRTPSEPGEPAGTDRRQIGRRSDAHVGGLSLSLSFDGPTTPPSRIVQQFRRPESLTAASSAPVNVPDCRNLLRYGSSEPPRDGFDSADDDSGGGGDDGDGGGGEDDGDGDLPPHEYVSRRRQSAATSVLEGLGRTLKGRDMTRVRDAVLSRTGFLR